MQKSYDKGEEVFNRLQKQEQRERLLTCPQVMWTKKRQLFADARNLEDFQPRNAEEEEGDPA